MDVSEQIFRSYDIRGIAGKTITEPIMERIGHAVGAYFKKPVVVAHDARVHSPALTNAVMRGLATAGRPAEVCGLLPLGAGMFRAWQAKKPFVYITASHLPREWNGLKLFHASGQGFAESDNQKIKDLFFSPALPTSSTPARHTPVPSATVAKEYAAYLISRLPFPRSIDVVLDCGNGCAGIMAPDLFRGAGCTVTTLFEHPDGTFPNRLPDPIEKEVGALKASVAGHDFGIAYDGDADRTAIVDEQGNFLLPEETSYIILADLLRHQPGPVVANVECSRTIDAIAAKFNREVIRVPVGHTFLMEAVHRHQAAFGVESAGHYALPLLVPFDDAMVIGFYMAHVLAHAGRPLSELRADIPRAYVERRSFHCPDEKKFTVVDALKARLAKEFKHVNTLDGVRIDLDEGWALIRAANTSPYIRVTVEGSSPKDVQRLQHRFVAYVTQEMDRVGEGMVPEH